MRALPLLLFICALALLATPAMANDVTIPINKDYKSGDMLVHITKVTITDRYWGNTYSADPDNTIWPKVWFTYENRGKVPVNGNLYVAFADDKGNKYWDTRHSKPIADITMSPIAPGTISDERFVEAAAPRGTRITQVLLYDQAMNQAMAIDIPGGNVVTATTPAASSTAQASGGPSGVSKICPALLLPLLFVGMVAALKIKR